MTEGVWTDDRVELLKKLFDAGFSASQIANELKSGISRNAVIGKIHRLGLSRVLAKKPSVAKPRVRVARPTRLSLSFNPSYTPKIPAEPFEARLARVQPLHLSLDQLKLDTCRYPYGETGPFTFCGCKVQIGRPYCPEHVELCTVAKGFVSEETRQKQSDAAKERWRRQRERLRMLDEVAA